MLLLIRLGIVLVLIGYASVFTQMAYNQSKLGDKKIALLFLTKGELWHGDFWKLLLDQSEQNKNISLYIHSKEPINDPYFKQFRIKNVVYTMWSRHVFAWQSLLKEALLEPKNHYFIFLSEACIPLQNLDSIYEAIIKNDKTLMSFSRPWWKEPSSRDVLEIPVEHRWANHEWVILTRADAALLAKDCQIIKLISKHDNDQESWPSSVLSIFNRLNFVENIKTTYVNWAEPAKDDYLPRQFFEATDKNIHLLREAKNNGFLFARKVMKDFPREELIKLINE